jgi:hypothetical protein
MKMLANQPVRPQGAIENAQGIRRQMNIVPKKYQVTQEHESPYPDPMESCEGEHVEIGDEFADDPDWKNWVWCKGKTNQA